MAVRYAETTHALGRRRQVTRSHARSLTVR
jgi:hypothetical protein